MRSETGHRHHLDLPSDLDPKKTVFISAGEASGDLHASMFMKEFKKLLPGVTFVGMGGREMVKEGLIRLIDMNSVSVVGITEVAGKIFHILRARELLKRAILRIAPRLMVLVDFPDFNMSLLGLKKKIGAKVFYLIPPQVWAWREGRVRRLKRYVDSMAVILPFEEAYFRRMGLEATYVGNPLVEIYRDIEFGGKDGATVGVLPGSRPREVERHLPVIYNGLVSLKEKIWNLNAIVSVAPSIETSYVKAFLKPHADWISFGSGAKEVLERASVCCVVSGTATLEAALMGVPMVVLYKVSKASYMLGRWLSKVKYISLVNLIAGKRIVPELIQDEANPSKLQEKLLELLKDVELRMEMKRALRTVRERVFSGIKEPPSKKAARLAMGLLVDRA